MPKSDERDIIRHDNEASISPIHRTVVIQLLPMRSTPRHHPTQQYITLPLHLSSCQLRIVFWLHLLVISSDQHWVTGTSRGWNHHAIASQTRRRNLTHQPIQVFTRNPTIRAELQFSDMPSSIEDNKRLLTAHYCSTTVYDLPFHSPTPYHFLLHMSHSQVQPLLDDA